MTDTMGRLATQGRQRDWMDQWDSRKSEEGFSSFAAAHPHVVALRPVPRERTGHAAEKSESFFDTLGVAAIVIGVFAAAFAATWLTHEYRWTGAVIPVAGVIGSFVMYFAFRSNLRDSQSKN